MPLVVKVNAGDRVGYNKLRESTAPEGLEDAWGFRLQTRYAPD